MATGKGQSSSGWPGHLRPPAGPHREVPPGRMQAFSCQAPKYLTSIQVGRTSAPACLEHPVINVCLVIEADRYLVLLANH